MKRVLLVDDKEENRYLLQVLLQGNGYATEVACHGGEALTLAQAAPPDLVIADLLMPVMDGYTLLRHWRADERLREVPFMVYTATYTDPADEKLALDLGADVFLRKPAEPDQIMTCLRALEGSGPRPQRAGETLAPAREAELLKLYNETLVRKLEKRSGELEQRLQQLSASEAQLRESERVSRLSRRALEASANGIMIAVAGRRERPINYVNPAFERITGYAESEVLGRDPRFLLGEDREQLGVADVEAALREQREVMTVLRCYRRDGTPFWNELSIAPVFDDDGALTHYVGVINDISERKRYEEQLERQYNQDALTGLASRNLLHDRTRQAIAYAAHHGRSVALLCIDLDHFKRINDSLGHGFGDGMLQAVTERIQACVRERDTLARLGGDEFVALLTDMNSLQAAPAVAAKILEALHAPLQVAGREIEISASIGVAVYPDDGDAYDTLLRNADTAMYRAKEAGRNTVRFYTADMNASALRRLDLEAKLRRALQQEAFALQYQPLLSAADGSVGDVEALLRWSDEGRLVGPDEFVPLAEESGLIVPIGDWVLRQACLQARRWRDQGVELRVAVNLSARQFRDDGLIEVVRGALENSGLPARQLKLEITESAVMEQPEQATRILAELKALGLSISVDDFGTGYSSLSYLRRFPIDQLKIDRSFVQEVTRHRDSAAIVRSVIALARDLRLQTVAEGVESEAQHAFLVGAGCDLLQGYLFSRPLDAEALLEWLRTQEGGPM